jgi:hypothetical protein
MPKLPPKLRLPKLLQLATPDLYNLKCVFKLLKTVSNTTAKE